MSGQYIQKWMFAEDLSNEWVMQRQDSSSNIDEEDAWKGWSILKQLGAWYGRTHTFFVFMQDVRTAACSNCSLSLCFCFQKKETCCLPGMNTVKHDQTMLPRLPMFVRRSLFVDQLFAACFWLNASKCRLEKTQRLQGKIRKKFRSSRKKCVVDCRKKTAHKERCIHTIRWGTYTREFKRSKTE